MTFQGVKVYGVACRTYSHMIDSFYRDIAARTGGLMIPLDKFDLLFDLMMAICYREGGEDLLEVILCFSSRAMPKTTLKYVIPCLPFLLVVRQMPTTFSLIVLRIVFILINNQGFISSRYIRKDNTNQSGIVIMFT